MAIVGKVEDGILLDNEVSEAASTTKSTSGTDMGYDQFLQLLCAEMQYQDPLEPTSNTEYVAQLATFSQLEAMLSMQTTMEETNASDLVGKYVIVQNSDMADSVAGYVDYVQFDSGEQYVYVNGSKYSVDDIYQVADPEYMEAVTLAESFKNTVDNLPDADELTMDSENDVLNAASVYSAMSSYQQSYVDSDTLKKFNDVVSKMAELETAYYNSQSQTSTDSTAATADEAAETVDPDA